MLIIMSKVKSLGLQFTVQSPCIPLPHLVWQLEVISCRLDVNKSHVHSTLLSIGVPVGSLLEIYDKMFTINDRCWLLEGNEFHLIQVIASFADSFIANPKIAPMNERYVKYITIVNILISWFFKTMVL
ncbi:hypothetical protein AAG570_002937 [Ranatra chinensis]|uniref:Nucleoporin Nup133/Nup155-like C-terminal domain-containing protein n=1 Tax=Ranatra chinensis TaxID=642074 RepID=A0ABD0Y5F0_9HEMI